MTKAPIKRNAAPGAKRTSATISRKGHTKRPSFTLREQGKTLLTTPHRDVAEKAAWMLFEDLRSVSLISNADGKTLQHWIYGRPQR